MTLALHFEAIADVDERRLRVVQWAALTFPKGARHTIEATSTAFALRKVLSQAFPNWVKVLHHTKTA
jgi:hypothetical protein